MRVVCVCGWDDMVGDHLYACFCVWLVAYAGWVVVPFFLGLVFVPVRGNSRVVCEL